MPRPSKIEEFKRLILRWKKELKKADVSFSRLADYLKMRGLDVDASTLVNWAYQLDGKSFGDVTISLIGKRWEGWDSPQAPYTQPRIKFYNRAVGVHIHAPGCPDELWPASPPLPPVPIFLLKLAYQEQNLEALELGPEPDPVTLAKWLLRQREIEKAEEELILAARHPAQEIKSGGQPSAPEETPLTTGGEGGYVLRDRDAVYPSGYQLRT
jgi:hypothetical protein